MTDDKQEKITSEKLEQENIVNLAETEDLVQDIKFKDNKGHVHKVKNIATSIIEQAKNLHSKRKDLTGKAINKARNLSPYVDKFITNMDKSIVYLTVTNPLDGRSEAIQETRSPSVFGVWILIFTFGFCFMWALFAPLDSASDAMGRIVLESKKKIIQHPRGGIVKSILVKDGDEVKQGQTLAILDDTQVKANKKQEEHQYFALLAENARLMAERDNLENIDFPENLMRHKSDIEVANAITNQQKLFEVKKTALLSKISIYEKELSKNTERKNAISAQIEAVEKQIKIIEEQFATAKKLFANANYSKLQLQDLESKKAALYGHKGEYISKELEIEQTIIQSQNQINNTKDDFYEKVSQELKENQTKVDVYKERLLSVNDELAHTVITSPEDGKVSNIADNVMHHGYLAQQQVLMEIIPQNDKLIIEAKIKAQDIPVVHVGQTARVRLISFRARIVPILEGKVVSISPDVIFPDQKDSYIMQMSSMQPQAYYRANIEIDNNQLAEAAELKGVKLYPGMPAQIMIILGTRTMMQYLLDPIMTTLSKSFIER